MSQRVTISVPDDVAAQLAAIPSRQVSAYVSEALRRRRASDEIRAALSVAGHRDFPYEPDGSARRLAAQRVPAEVRDSAITRLTGTTGHTANEIRAELRPHPSE